MNDSFRTSGPRKRMFRVKLTEPEGAALERMAADLGWSMSDVVRDALDHFRQSEFYLESTGAFAAEDAQAKEEHAKQRGAALERMAAEQRAAR